jgi:hypothetical protein
MPDARRKKWREHLQVLGNQAKSSKVCGYVRGHVLLFFVYSFLEVEVVEVKECMLHVPH